MALLSFAYRSESMKYSTYEFAFESRKIFIARALL
jgi:hypothetical protein